MSPDTLPMALNRLHECVDDADEAMHVSNDYDDLCELAVNAQQEANRLMEVSTLAYARAEGLIGKRG